MGDFEGAFRAEPENTTRAAKENYSSFNRSAPRHVKQFLAEAKTYFGGDTAAANHPPEDGFDGEKCKKYHEFRRLDTCVKDSQTSRTSPLLSSLKTITLLELTLGRRHDGRVLHGHLRVLPFKSSGIHTVLEDAGGKAVWVQIHVDEEVEDRFRIDMGVAIKEPLLKSYPDGEIAICVHDLEDICLTDSENSLPAGSSNAEFVEYMEKTRLEGIRQCVDENWDAADREFSQRISEATLKAANDSTIKDSTIDLNKELLKSYSSRAKVRLELRRYEEALSDADQALRFDPRHVISVIRRGRALQELGLFEKAIMSFKNALALSPGEPLILHCINAATFSFQQSQFGVFDVSKYVRGGFRGQVPPCADYVGAIEIRPISLFGNASRGLFSKRGIQTGEILCVSNPLAIGRRSAELDQPRQDAMRSKARAPKGGASVLGDLGLKSHQDLVVDLVNRVKISKRAMAQLYSLSSDSKQDMQTPSMDFFKPGSEWIPSNPDNLHLDIGLIKKIVDMNSFGGANDLDFDKISCFTGLWILPSFLNHSCVPNAILDFIGDAMFLRASRGLKAGEEISISYFDHLYNDLDARQTLCANWSFKCKCERCAFEENKNFQSLFKKIKIDFPDLERFLQGRQRFMNGHGFDMFMEGSKGEEHAFQNLSKVADQVESWINSHQILDPKFQGWIRTTFLPAYFLKLDIAGQSRDSQSRVQWLKTIVGAMTSVGAYQECLTFAALLLMETKLLDPNRNEVYRSTEQQVLGIFTAVFGKQDAETVGPILHNYCRKGTEEMKQAFQL